MTDIRKVREIYDERTQTYTCVYEAPGVNGGMVTAEAPREDQKPEVVARHLLSKGAVLPPVNDRRQPLANAIAAEAPICHRAKRNGWWGENQRFVSGRNVTIDDNDDTELYPPSGAVAAAMAPLEIRGTLADWQALARIALFSTLMMVALCVTFAAPLLKLVNRGSFGIVFFGPSRTGKSTAQLFGASPMGFGAEEDLPSLNATFAGLLDLAMAFNDHCFSINEIGTARGSKRDIHSVLRESTYSLTSGSDIIRHHSWSGNDGRGPASFKVILLLSSEHSPDVWASRGGEVRDDGETARMIGLPALFPGALSIFDGVPRRLTQERHAAWAAEKFRIIREGVIANRGVVFRDYTAWLAEDVNASTKGALACIAYFEKKVITPRMSAIERDIVGKFAVLYAGGIAAVWSGVLPLSNKDVLYAIHRACLAAIRALPDPQSDLRADFTTLKNKLSGSTVLDMQHRTDKKLDLLRNADGYIELTVKGGRNYVIRAQSLSNWFSSEPRCRRLLERLDDQGLLKHTRERNKVRSNEWAQQQVTWPNGTRVRSIVIFLPRGNSDLDIIA